MRAALRAVPPADRRRLELPEDVLEALCADVLEDIQATRNRATLSKGLSRRGRWDGSATSVLGCRREWGLAADER